jgi:hypothetical protein
MPRRKFAKPPKTFIFRHGRYKVVKVNPPIQWHTEATNLARNDPYHPQRIAVKQLPDGRIVFGMRMKREA